MDMQAQSTKPFCHIKKKCKFILVFTKFYWQDETVPKYYSMLSSSKWQFYLLRLMYVSSVTES